MRFVPDHLCMEVLTANMLHYVYLINRFQLHHKSKEMMEKLKKVSEELGRDYEFVVNETVPSTMC